VDESLCRERPWIGCSCRDLVRTRFIVEAHVLGDEAPEVISLRMRHVEQLSAERADERSAKAFISGACTAVRTTRTQTTEYAGEAAA